MKIKKRFVLTIAGEKGVEAWMINQDMVDEICSTLCKGQTGKKKKAICAGIIRYQDKVKCLNG